MSIALRTTFQSFRVSLFAGAGLAALGSGLFAQNQPAPTTPGSNPSTATTEALTPQTFVQKAAWSGKKEVALSQLAQTQAKDEEVREFAKTMVDDHTKANQELMQLAQTKAYTLPAEDPFRAGAATSSQPGASATDPARPATSGTTGQGTSGSNPSTTGTAGQGAPNSTAGTAGTAATGEAADKQKDLESYQKLQSLSGEEFDKAYIQEMVKDHEKAVALFQSAQSLTDPELKAFAEKTLPTLQEHQQHVQKIAKDNNWESTTGDSSSPATKKES